MKRPKARGMPDSPDAVEPKDLRAPNAAFDEQMAVAREVMARDRRILRELAKYPPCP